jgi:DNA polymerase delta subunit 1
MATHKRVLHDATNINRASPLALKKQKLDSFGRSSQSQPKSQFEETLEKLSQGISELKQNNAEKDQQWSRPSLDSFKRDKPLVFQQIEIEQGTLLGNTTLRLFGITEVS